MAATLERDIVNLGKELSVLLEKLEDGLPNDARYELRAPTVLMHLVERISKRTGMSVASYIRMALIEKLSRDIEQGN